MLDNIEFANPQLFWLLLLLPLALIWHIFKRKEETATLKISTVEGFTSNDLLPKLKPVLFVFRLLALTAIIVAMARPQTEDRCFFKYVGKGFKAKPIIGAKRSGSRFY